MSRHARRDDDPRPSPRRSSEPPSYPRPVRGGHSPAPGYEPADGRPYSFHEPRTAQRQGSPGDGRPYLPSESRPPERPRSAADERPYPSYATAERARPPVPPVPPAYRPFDSSGPQPPLTGHLRKPAPPLPSAGRSRRPPKTEPTPAPPGPTAPGQSRAGRLRLRINPITCDGHGLCAELLPELLATDDWGYPSPIVTEIPRELEVHAQRAAQQCPTLAILLERRRPSGGPA